MVAGLHQSPFRVSRLVATEAPRADGRIATAAEPAPRKRCGGVQTAPREHRRAQTAPREAARGTCIFASDHSALRPQRARGGCRLMAPQRRRFANAPSLAPEQHVAATARAQRALYAHRNVP
eukprot:CAMPEP_0185830474 /NCGR_PEP_ID=MMETSP1353-20130828/877_1 /TAXON_ID=1077150 /ORGANISM="Erythrolobus australicus, Strain CCMP3124" /LENGTH=121 /DNA_ID=CAMNT_0028528387 /DNA_START=970 /DNA_END=1332 /DNA_ORIENTATION=-